jgi:tetratricopeptide (TPR) repeat protein
MAEARSSTRKIINLPQVVRQALELHGRGRFNEAETLYAEILAAKPDHFDALHMLGLLKLQRGKSADALRLIAAALKAKPVSAEALLNHGNVLNALNRHEEALASYDQALAIKPRYAEALNNRGSVLGRLTRHEEALTSYERALKIKPDYAEALYNQGNALRALDRDEEALKSYERVLAIRPDHAQAHNNRGNALQKLGRHQEALASYERAFALKPDFVEALSNRGNALQSLGRIREALESYARALALKPDYAEALYNQGNGLVMLGRHREALESYAWALAIKPDHAEAQWNQGLARLRLGDFHDGWKQYEWRWQRPDGAQQRSFAQPLWSGQQSLQGKTILLHAEQGLGDSIQFVRYAALVARRGAKVILEVQRTLKDLLARVEGVSGIVGRGEELPAFDLHCPLLSLPLAFNTELGSILASVPYVTAADDRIEIWNARLPPRKGLRVGIAWSGNAKHKDDRNRSIALSRLAPLFDAPGVQFVSLQKDVRDGEAEALRNILGLLDLGPDLKDFADTAAVMSLLDLVISVDTSTAHLAGAMGKPIFILLPFSPDWRWLLEREDSPWYPTARLFRQPKIGDWESVIERVRRELAHGRS